MIKGDAGQRMVGRRGLQSGQSKRREAAGRYPSNRANDMKSRAQWIMLLSKWHKSNGLEPAKHVPPVFVLFTFIPFTAPHSLFLSLSFNSLSSTSPFFFFHFACCHDNSASSTDTRLWQATFAICIDKVNDVVDQHCGCSLPSRQKGWRGQFRGPLRRFIFSGKHMTQRKRLHNKQWFRDEPAKQPVGCDQV